MRITIVALLFLLAASGQEHLKHLTHTDVLLSTLSPHSKAIYKACPQHQLPLWLTELSNGWKAFISPLMASFPPSFRFYSRFWENLTPSGCGLNKCIAFS